LSATKLSGIHRAIRIRLYKNLLEQLGPGQVLGETLFQLDIAFERKRIGKVFQFPGKKTVRIKSQSLVFIVKSE